jgi:hypothetical protein
MWIRKYVFDSHEQISHTKVDKLKEWPMTSELSPSAEGKPQQNLDLYLTFSYAKASGRITCFSISWKHSFRSISSIKE